MQLNPLFLWIGLISRSKLPGITIERHPGLGVLLIESSPDFGVQTSSSAVVSLWYAELRLGATLERQQKIGGYIVVVDATAPTKTTASEKKWHSHNKHEWEWAREKDRGRCVSERAQISAVNFYGTVFLSPLYHGIANSRVQIHASTSKEEEEMVGTWLGEICSCSCLTLLPGSALVPLNLIDTFILWNL